MPINNPRCPSGSKLLESSNHIRGNLNSLRSNRDFNEPVNPLKKRYRHSFINEITYATGKMIDTSRGAFKFSVGRFTTIVISECNKPVKIFQKYVRWNLPFITTNCLPPRKIQSNSCCETNWTGPLTRRQKKIEINVIMDPPPQALVIGESRWRPSCFGSLSSLYWLQESVCVPLLALKFNYEIVVESGMGGGNDKSIFCKGNIHYLLISPGQGLIYYSGICRVREGNF